MIKLANTAYCDHQCATPPGTCAHVTEASCGERVDRAADRCARGRTARGDMIARRLDAQRPSVDGISHRHQRHGNAQVRIRECPPARHERRPHPLDDAHRSSTSSARRPLPRLPSGPPCSLPRARVVLIGTLVERDAAVRATLAEAILCLLPDLRRQLQYFHDKIVRP